MMGVVPIAIVFLDRLWWHLWRPVLADRRCRRGGGIYFCGAALIKA
jgi:hypothetical protein